MYIYKYIYIHTNIYNFHINVLLVIPTSLLPIPFWSFHIFPIGFTCLIANPMQKMATEIGNCRHAQTQPAAFLLLYSSQAQSNAVLNASLSLGEPSSDHPKVFEWEYELSACSI